MELRAYLDFLRRRWWLLLVCPLVAGAAAYFVSKQLAPIYRATATVLVNQTQSPGIVQYNDVLTSERLTNTYAELVKREPVLAEVKKRLGLSITEDALSQEISVSNVQNTQLLHIAVEDRQAQRAVAIADTTAQAFIDDNAKQLGSRPGTLSIAEQAQLPHSPVKPNIKLNTALALIVGLLFGGGLGLLIEYLDDTIKSPEDVEAATSLPTLGTVTRFHPNGRGKNGQPRRVIEPASAEAYRQIRTNVHFALLRPGSKVILVTSTNPREGKSTTACNLALVLAQAGERVALVDLDLRRPSLHTMLGSPNSFGLTGLLLSEAEDAAAGQVQTNLKNLVLLPSGPLPANPSELLMSPQTWKIIDSLRERVDFVILDSPPVLAVTDASILASHADGTIIVVEPGRTRSAAFQRARQTLAQTNARVLGVVFNKVKARSRGYYYYGSYSQQEQRAVNATPVAEPVPGPSGLAGPTTQPTQQD